MPRLSLTILPLLAFAFVAGCRPSTDSPSPGKPAPSAAPSAAITKRYVTKEDCTTWATHATDVIIAGFNEAATSCPQDQRDGLAKKLAGERKQLLDAGRDVCLPHVDSAYQVSDAACVMNATDVHNLMACKFAPLTSRGDSDVGAEVEAIRRSCQTGGRTAPSASGARRIDL